MYWLDLYAQTPVCYPPRCRGVGQASRLYQGRKDIPKPVHKKAHTLAVAFWMALPMSQNAQASPERDALLFVDSQVLPKKAAACSARISGYSAKFDPVFRTWLSTNKEHVAFGEAFLRADAERTKMPFEPDIQAVAIAISQQWATAPLTMLQENCEAMLLQLREASNGG